LGGIHGYVGSGRGLLGCRRFGGPSCLHLQGVTTQGTSTRSR